MSDLLHINLIHLFDFYLASVFLIGTYRRLQLYHDYVRIAVALPNRYPNLVRVLRTHHTLFLTGATLRPAAFALALLVTQTVCSRLIWPRAAITGEDLLHEWWMIPAVVSAAVAMLTVDVLGVLRVARIDRAMVEGYLDTAEGWLTSWKTPVLRALTLGFVDPRRIVHAEVRKALEVGRTLVEAALRWMALQAALRVLFGLTLWLTWAWHPTAGAGPMLERPTTVLKG